MKFNKWTLGLAAVGAVSVASLGTARADTGNLSQIQAAAEGITISAAVDTSIEWAITPHGDDGANQAFFPPFREGKQDGFNLNVVQVNIAKALGEEEWASGFLISLLFGPDANFYNSSVFAESDNDIAIKNAYVNLRTPVGNGIEWKIGVFSTIIGYEVFESWKNPNFSRSWGYSVEPTEHTGILGSYQFNDVVSVSAGVANTWMAGINTRSGDIDDWWCKSVMGSLTLTAPDSMGALAGSTAYLGTVYGYNGGDDQFNLYAGAVVNTPVENLTAGLAFDYATADAGDSSVMIIGLYTSYRFTEKLSVHGRGELGWFDSDDSFSDDESCFWGITGTLQYDLWENVISRLELRYEHEDDSGFTDDCGLGLYANFVYVF